MKGFIDTFLNVNSLLICLHTSTQENILLLLYMFMEFLIMYVIWELKIGWWMGKSFLHKRWFIALIISLSNWQFKYFFHMLHQLLIIQMLHWLFESKRGIKNPQETKHWVQQSVPFSYTLASESDAITINCPSTAHMGSILWHPVHYELPCYDSPSRTATLFVLLSPPTHQSTW